MKITENQKELIQEYVDATDVYIHHDYSGRNMFGEKCFGIVGKPNLLAELMIELTEDGEAKFAKSLLKASRIDSMGLSTIYYFPGFTW